MSFDEFLKTAWDDHGDRPREVADRLAASLSLVASGANVTPFAQIVSHVYGEHLGEWHQGVQLLERVGVLPVCEAGSAGAATVRRNIAALLYSGGVTTALDGLSTEDRIAALGAVTSAMAGRNEFKRAIAAYSEALRAAEPGLPEKSPALRSLAVGGNNLAAALEEKNDRDAEETAGMLSAAQGGLKYWKLAGTWLEEERAEYRLAKSLLKAGHPQKAVEAAKRCVEVCEANTAPAFERVFGFAVLALAQREAGDRASFEASLELALKEYEQVPQDERQWCEPDLAEIRG